MVPSLDPGLPTGGLLEEVSRLLFYIGPPLLVVLVPGFEGPPPCIMLSELLLDIFLIQRFTFSFHMPLPLSDCLPHLCLHCQEVVV